MLEKAKDFIKKNHFIIILCLTIALSFISLFSVKAYSITIYISTILVSVFYGLNETIIFWLICPFFERILNVHILALLLVVLTIQLAKDVIRRRFKFEKKLIFPIVISIILIVMCFAVFFEKENVIRMLRYIEVTLICLEFFCLMGKLDLEKVLKISAVVLIVSFIFSFAFNFIDKSLPICNIDSAGLKRYHGLTGHENILAIYSISYMAFFILFYFKKSINIWTFCIFEIVFFALGFLTMSKAFLLLFILLAVCYFIKAFTSNKKIASIQFGVACVVLVVFTILFKSKIISLFNRFILYEKGDGVLNMITTGRMRIWERFYWTWCSKLSYIFFGIGATFYPENYVHNFYFDLVVKFGVVGFMLILALVYYYISVVVKNKKIHFENLIPIIILACYMFIEIFMDVRILFIIFAVEGLAYFAENKEESESRLDAKEKFALELAVQGEENIQNTESNQTEVSENESAQVESVIKKPSISKIPKILHYVWLGGKPLPEKNRKFLESWKKFCPDYEIKLWNEKNFDIEHSCDYVKEAYRSKKYAFVADYIRLLALYNYGGIYLDTDVEILKPLDDLLDNQLFFCRENNAYISTAVIGSQKRNPILRQMLETYWKRHFILEDGSFDISTNVETISLFLRQKYDYPLNSKRFETPDLNIYESTYFSPKDYFSGKCKSTKNSYAIHHFDGTWDTTNKGFAKKMAKFVFKISPKFIVFAIVNKVKVRKLKKEEKALKN